MALCLVVAPAVAWLCLTLAYVLDSSYECRNQDIALEKLVLIILGIGFLLAMVGLLAPLNMWLRVVTILALIAIWPFLLTVAVFDLPVFLPVFALPAALFVFSLVHIGGTPPRGAGPFVSYVASAVWLPVGVYFLGASFVSRCGSLF